MGFGSDQAYIFAPVKSKGPSDLRFFRTPSDRLMFKMDTEA